MSTNRVVLTGRLTADPELRASGGGMAILKMRLAFDDRRKNSESGQWENVSNFIDVTMFGQRADAVSRFLQKGKQIAVDGKLRMSEWQDKNTGDKRSKIEVIADDIELLGSRDSGVDAYDGASYSGPSAKKSAAPAQSAPSEEAFTDDIPF